VAAEVVEDLQGQRGLFADLGNVFAVHRTHLLANLELGRSEDSNRCASAASAAAAQKAFTSNDLYSRIPILCGQFHPNPEPGHRLSPAPLGDGDREAGS
jgi:hypothetical protein